MKISTPLFSLIAASTAAISSAKGIDKNIINQLTEQCRAEITDSENEIYNKCDINIRIDETKINPKPNAEECFPSSWYLGKCLDGLKGRCETLQSEECIKYYTDPVSYFPQSCVNDPTLIKYSDLIKNTATVTNDYYCTVDSKGNYCPSHVDEDELKDCEYKTCIDNLEKYYETIKNNYGIRSELFGTSDSDISTYLQKLEKLKSTECTSKTKDSNVFSNGASTIKVFSSFISLLLLYVIF